MLQEVACISLLLYLITKTHRQRIYYCSLSHEFNRGVGYKGITHYLQLRGYKVISSQDTLCWLFTTKQYFIEYVPPTTKVTQVVSELSLGVKTKYSQFSKMVVRSMYNTSQNQQHDSRIYWGQLDVVRDSR